MFLIFKLRARLLQAAKKKRLVGRCAASDASATRTTAITACVCVFSSLCSVRSSNQELDRPTRSLGRSYSLSKTKSDILGAYCTEAFGYDDEDGWDYDEEEMVRFSAAKALALLVAQDQPDVSEAKALQLHEVERSCRLGLSVSLLEELWMERIVIELQQLAGQRRRRIKRLGTLPKDIGYLAPYDVLPIHKYPDLTAQCCRLINAEWPRSEVARMRSLQSSGDCLPTNLVLTRDFKESVLAHVKLSPIPSRPNGCFIESMVVRKALRGQGLGKLLMRYAEDYAADFLRCDEMYLSTIDSEGFYEKQGYEVCQPVNMYGLSMGYVPQSNNAKKIYMKKPLKGIVN